MKAVGQSVIVKQIDQPADSPVKTPDGKHPWAIQVVDVSDQIDTPVKKGDIVAAQGNLKELAGEHFIVNLSQIVAIMDTSDL